MKMRILVLIGVLIFTWQLFTSISLASHLDLTTCSFCTQSRQSYFCYDPSTGSGTCDTVDRTTAGTICTLTCAEPKATPALPTVPPGQPTNTPIPTTGALCPSCISQNQYYCRDTTSSRLAEFCLPQGSEDQISPGNVRCQLYCSTTPSIPPPKATCSECISRGVLFCTIPGTSIAYCQHPRVAVYPDDQAQCQATCAADVIPTATPTINTTPTATPTITPTPLPPTVTPTAAPGRSALALSVNLFGSNYTPNPRSTLSGTVELTSGTDVVRTLVDVPFNLKLQSAPTRTYEALLPNIPFGTYKARALLAGFLSRSSLEITTGTRNVDNLEIAPSCRDKNSCVVAGDITGDDLVDIADFSSIIDLVRADFCDEREKGPTCRTSPANLNDDQNVDIFDFQAEVNLLRENKDVHGDGRAPGLVGN